MRMMRCYIFNEHMITYLNFGPSMDYRNGALDYIFYANVGPARSLGIPTTRMWAPSRALEPPFKARVGSPLHGSLAIPIFSAKHALAKEKGPSLLVMIFHIYSHYKQLTEKKTAEHGQKSRSPDGLVTPASASFHDLRLVHFLAFLFSLPKSAAGLWNSWSSAGMLRGSCFNPMFKETCPAVFEGVGPELKAHRECKTRLPLSEILLSQRAAAPPSSRIRKGNKFLFFRNML
ncbi:hypothetical protein D5086_016744 [Populus alba]|uniref:Uncharacterized protein n=1 Tax=Populus alba TaxID=43335 RepID=A0ACC4BW83_POPAL